MTKTQEESVNRRAAALFEARDGLVTDTELCRNFNDEEVHYLFTRSHARPVEQGIWRWVKDQPSAS